MILAEPTAFATIEPICGLFRQEANCQIIKDSILERGLADAYAIRVEGVLAGYGEVWNKYDPGQAMEFYTLPAYRPLARPMAKAFLDVSQATTMEAQTNIPLMVTTLFDFCTDVVAQNVLFGDAFTSNLTCPGAVLRASEPKDETEDGFVLEVNGRVVGSGGYLTHYNPPYGDIYMSIRDSERGKGYGSFLVQELKRVCYEAGRKPAARCNADNEASRRTMEKAGLLPVGLLLVGQVRR